MTRHVVRVSDCAGFCWGVERALEMTLQAAGYKPRTVAGIAVEWEIDSNGPSLGVFITVDGVAITPAKRAFGKTDASGYSRVQVYSEVVGRTLLSAMADYPMNPYPEQLYSHEDAELSRWQPDVAASMSVTWRAP